MQLKRLREEDPELAGRLEKLRQFSRQIRSSEYHLTNACNLRCSGCWFFEYGHEKASKEITDVDQWREFAAREANDRGMTSALLIGGEPSLYQDRIASFVEEFQYVTVSSNGLQKIPYEGFEMLTVALTLFGGVNSDDELRAIKPSGARFTGLFETALENYKDDPRAIFIYALSAASIADIEPTVKRIHENGNIATFNYYSEYGQSDPLRRSGEQQLLAEALRVQQLYPDTIACDPYYVRTLILGKTEWGEFGYDVCPSISVDHPDHKDRIRKGSPVLPNFNSFAADGKSLNFCCTSGHCDGCRDSQAVFSWLMVSLRRFMGSKEDLETWISVSESYWSQFVWSPYHRFAQRDSIEIVKTVSQQRAPRQ